MSPRLRFIARRLLLTVPVLLAMSIFVFLMIRLVPGDPVRTMLGFRATDENVAVVRAALGLDLPIWEQYATWLGGVLRFDLGQDFISKAPLTTLLAERLPVTLELTILAMGLALLVGIPAGVLAATRGRTTGRAASAFVIAGISIPDFWLGIMLVLLFAGTLGLLPPSGYTPFLEDPLGNLRYMALPVLTLAVGEAAYILRTTRAAMEETLASPYIAFLRAKGIGERRIVYTHALRNASIPILTVVGIQFGVLLGGAIVVETLFALPGVGRLIVTAINQRNYPVIQAGILVVAALFIVVNLITDLLYGALDPRLAEDEA
ncbi:MAG TPA: ABC transporter permease [Candidatus Limnocylindrales bacterium]|nr:ABC transporter permease [Candidatus Limnocylindrales bacterium]